jgi:hypothetical protein
VAVNHVMHSTHSLYYAVIVIVIGGIKVQGSDKTAGNICRYQKDQYNMIPTIQGLSTLRDAYTFPVSQSKLEI